jgi:putative SOS response-associated peptidase YedK
MPAILEDADIDTWLAGTPDEARSVLRPYADASMREHAVSRSLNSPNAEPEGLPPPSAQELAAAEASARGSAGEPRQQSLGFD